MDTYYHDIINYRLIISQLLQINYKSSLVAYLKVNLQQETLCTKGRCIGCQRNSVVTPAGDKESGSGNCGGFKVKICSVFSKTPPW